MDRFADKDVLREFYKNKGIDGVELMPVGGTDIPEKLTVSDVNGVHLGFFPYWYDFWTGNMGRLVKMFGSEDICREYYGGADKTAIVSRISAELDMAQRLNAKYVVFHVSECSLDECFTYNFTHTDEEVCDAAAEIINAVLDGKDYGFYFLCENLWWSGLTMTRPEIVKRLMEKISYPKKGIMLDTGHLLHTNRKLRTQDEGIVYINEILDRNAELCEYIKGVHLQQSLSGEYVESVIASPPDLDISYCDKLMLTYPHIFKIDRHRPFTASGVARLIKRISPEFLTYELITENNEEHESALIEQLNAIKNEGGL